MRSCRILSLVLLVGTVRLLANSPSPYTEWLDLSISVTISGGGGSAGVIVYGEGTAGSANASANSGESSAGVAWLRPARSYNVAVIGALIGRYVGYNTYNFSGNYSLSFTAPAGYSIYINNQPTDLYTRSYSTNRNTNLLYINDSYTIELRPDANGAAAPAGSFSGVELGKSVTWEVGLGCLRSGQSAGRILFKEKDLTNSPAARDRLYYVAPANNNQITVVMNNALSQISSPQTVVDLVDDPGGGYWFKFYTPAQATWSANKYIFSGDPWRTIRVTSSGRTS